MKWERVEGEITGSDGLQCDLLRSKVPGGWLVVVYDGVFDRAEHSRPIFIPDPRHEWGLGWKDDDAPDLD
jgi:hypothetical protein